MGISWYFGLVWVLILALVHPLPGWAMSAATGQEVLEVIAKHPEAIINSLKSYNQQQAQQKQQAQAQAFAQVRQDLPKFLAQSPVRGDRTAKVLLVEFADFQCPYCVRAHAPIQELLDKHPEVSFVFKHLPLVEIHDQAMPAARAVWAAGQQRKFWQFYDRLFEEGELTDDRYLRIAQQLELNLAEWERDRTDLAAAQAIQADRSQASALGIQGTPFFLVVTESSVNSVSGADVSAIETYLSQG